MIKVNLLRPSKKEIKETAPLPEEEITVTKVKERKPLNLTKLIVPFAVLLVAVLFYTQRTSVNREKSLLNDAREQKKKLEYVFTLLQERELKKALYEKKINLIRQLKLRQGVPVVVMDELSKQLPDWIWLTEVSFNRQRVQLKGKALSNNLIADYIYNLENSPSFNNVNLVASTQKRIRNDQILEFSMNAAFVLPQQATPAGVMTGKTQKGGSK
jgi:Tfp pilus assembly protein PilN